jgi:opacity protein-like surface antigen
MKSITTLSTLAALLLATNVQANQDVSGFYIGAGVGSTDAEAEYNGISESASTDGSTLKFIGGYQFNRIVAIEAQYTSYGEVKTDPGYKWEPTTISLAANLGYTFENGLRPFAVIGLSSLDLDQNVKVLDDSSATAIRFGAGLEYTPAALSGVSFRAGYEGDAFAIETNTASDIDVLIGSVYVAASYKF